MVIEHVEARAPRTSEPVRCRGQPALLSSTDDSARQVRSVLERRRMLRYSRASKRSDAVVTKNATATHIGSKSQLVCDGRTSPERRSATATPTAVKQTSFSPCVVYAVTPPPVTQRIVSPIGPEAGNRP